MDKSKLLAGGDVAASEGTGAAAAPAMNYADRPWTKSGTVLQCIACVLTPLLGPAVLQEIAARRLALLREKGNKAAAQQAIQDAKQAAGCAMCLVNLMWCTYTELITPLNLLCAW